MKELIEKLMTGAVIIDGFKYFIEMNNSGEWEVKKARLHSSEIGEDYYLVSEAETIATFSF